VFSRVLVDNALSTYHKYAVSVVDIRCGVYNGGAKRLMYNKSLKWIIGSFHIAQLKVRSSSKVLF